MTSAARTIIEATEDWGPGPPPFRVPPPPLPPFMLPDDLTDQEFCQTTLKPSLDSHLDVCDTTFPSIKSTSEQFQWLTTVIFALVGLLGLGLSLAVYLACRRWRKRNHLSYLRTKSNYEASNLASGTMAASTLPPERLSEHPLIYDDANIHFYRTSGTSTYLLDSSRGPSRSTMVRDISSLSSQGPSRFYSTNLMDENRIYEEVFLTEDPYGHYSRPLALAEQHPLQQPLQPLQSHGKKKNGGDSDQCYSSVYVPTNPNHHLIESSFSSSSTKASGSGLSCGLSGHSSSSQNTTCKRDRINLKAPGSASCSSSGSEENSLVRPSNTYNNTKELQKPWNTNGSLLEPVVIQQEENSAVGNMFSGLWNLNKRSLTHKRNPDMQQQPNNHAWMTLRVPTEQNQHLGALMTSKTLGRPLTASEANTVMPNPDDILPKEAWTDFSGTDEWPRFSEDHSLYVNSCQVKGLEEENGSLLANSQQIENNLMASSASTASSLEKGQWEERGGCQAKTENDNLKKKPPKPPVPARMGTASNKHCITHHQRKQPLKQQSPGNGGHANDITEDYSDSDLEEPLLIYKQLNPCSLNNLK